MLSLLLCQRNALSSWVRILLCSGVLACAGLRLKGVQLHDLHVHQSRVLTWAERPLLLLLFLLVLMLLELEIQVLEAGVGGPAGLLGRHCYLNAENRR